MLFIAGINPHLLMTDCDDCMFTYAALSLLHSLAVVHYIFLSFFNHRGVIVAALLQSIYQWAGWTSLTTQTPSLMYIFNL